MYKFPQKYHLRRRRDFERVFGIRCIVADDNLVMYITANSLKHSRLGLSMGKKLGKATVRNRFKRLIREAFRLQQIGSTRPGYDIICIPRSGRPRRLEEYQRSLVELIDAGIRKLQPSSQNRGSSC